ncbi:MAG: 4-hydroxy-tetrahydrodipicolinate reductase [Myxococcales bacterium]|nr:4-hydroxy-tetrahydrodipicolinate reductase [Myxococcales bacterium]
MSSFTPIAVLGATGRTGRHVVAAVVAHPDAQLVAAIGGPSSAHAGVDAGVLAGIGETGVTVRPCGSGCFGDAEVVVDFSLPSALAAALPWLGSRALVSGTTGLDAQGTAARAAHAERGPLLVASNFSIGVHVLHQLVARAVEALPDADIEIVEAHHRHKRDAPSGTALALAATATTARKLPPDALRHGRSPATIGARQADHIGMHAVRGGDVAGEHQVMLLAEGERVVLTHAASSRATFARGAVRAALWIQGKTAGTYSLSDVLERV